MSDHQKCATCGAPVRPVKPDKINGVPANYRGFWCAVCKKPVAAENVTNDRKHSTQYGGCGQPVSIVGVEQQAVEFDLEAVKAMLSPPQPQVEKPKK